MGREASLHNATTNRIFFSWREREITSFLLSCTKKYFVWAFYASCSFLFHSLTFSMSFSFSVLLPRIAIECWFVQGGWSSYNNCMRPNQMYQPSRSFHRKYRRVYDFIDIPHVLFSLRHSKYCRNTIQCWYVLFFPLIFPNTCIVSFS